MMTLIKEHGKYYLVSVPNLNILLSIKEKSNVSLITLLQSAGVNPTEITEFIDLDKDKEIKEE